MSDQQFKRVSVIGLGYVGLPTAAMFASRKIETVGVDTNKRSVETINRGEIHIIEPDLDMVVHAAVKQGYLSATTEPKPADAFLIAVPTPFKGKNHEPDLSYIQSAANMIAPVLERGNIVILESTSPVGTTDALADWLAEARPELTFPQTAGDDADVRVAYCPERVLPGKVMQELITNDRVIGGITPACSTLAVALYRTFVTGDCVIASGPRVAEMAKLTENSFRDVNIAFANELSMICDRLDMDVWELIELANRHPRVNILKPGPGVGGHCIAVDPWFVIASAPEEARLIAAAREVNDAKLEWVLGKIRTAIGTYLMEHTDQTSENVIVTIYGLAFKPDIDDLRESPALKIAHWICNNHPGPKFIYEPNIADLPAGLTDARFGPDAKIKSNIAVVLVKHRQFKVHEISADIVVNLVGLC